MAYIGAPPLNRVLSSDDIAQGAVTLDDINFTDQPTNMDITGTIDKHTMRLADGVTITGDVTISDDLVLSKISDDGNAITMTNDGSSRTITGSGSIEASTLSQTPNQSLTGMTGTVGSAVTGGAGLLPTGVTSLGTVTTGTLGSGVTFPVGHVIQTVQSSKLDATDMGHSPSFGTITGTDQAGSGTVFCCKITPTSTSNKILIVATICGQISSATNMVSQVSFFRGSTNLVNASSPGSRNASFWSGVQEDGTYVNQILRSFPFTYLDSPASTSEQTYQFKFRNGGSSEHLYVNRGEADSDGASHGRGQSSIVLMEVAG